MLKLVKLVGSITTFFAEELSPICFARFAVAFSLRLRVLVSGSTSVFAARRAYRGSCLRPAKHCLVSLIFSVSSSHFSSR